MASIGGAYAQVQTSALNADAIHPFGTIFNPLGRFAAIGESGSAPGLTTTGCDLYRFRAQTEASTAINMGIQSYVISSSESYVSHYFDRDKQRAVYHRGK